uniref:CNNM transmembrane domain-containing protein n=1 Tax=Schistocephalus solidus TaxID=70667 RepID=A0A183SKF2_SCHSO
LMVYILVTFAENRLLVYDVVATAAKIQLICTNSIDVLVLASGFLIQTDHPATSPRTGKLDAFPGKLLTDMLKLLIIPLIISSHISDKLGFLLFRNPEVTLNHEAINTIKLAGLANMDMRSCEKIGTYALLLYFTTALNAVLSGMILIVAIHPEALLSSNAPEIWIPGFHFPNIEMICVQLTTSRSSRFNLHSFDISMFRYATAPKRHNFENKSANISALSNFAFRMAAKVRIPRVSRIKDEYGSNTRTIILSSWPCKLIQEYIVRASGSKIKGYTYKEPKSINDTNLELTAESSECQRQTDTSTD